MKPFKTLDHFIIENHGELSRLLRDLSSAAKIVSREMNKGGLGETSGENGTVNIHAEQQQRLDVFANDQFISALERGGECCMVISEENEEHLRMDAEISKNARYIVALDPLDGSSNIDVNISVGTIFSVFRRKSATGNATPEDLMQRGIAQVAAGYILYGSSTTMVYTTGKGVNGFTLDPFIGEFCLSHPQMLIPDTGLIYSVNEGNYIHFPEGVKRYISYCKEADLPTGRPYTARYTGSMVADLHRTLIKGGIFIYPPTTSAPKGKLRLIYECNPMAWIIEQAGGMASDGRQRILGLEVKALHQCTPIFIGSKGMVATALPFVDAVDEDCLVGDFMLES